MSNTSQSISRSQPFVETITAKSREFVIVGLTGKTGTGVGDVAQLLSGPQLKQLLIQPALSNDFLPDEMRDFRIVQRYIREQWTPFVSVSAASVMLSFLLDLDSKDLQEVVYSFTEKPDANIYQIIDVCLTDKNRKNLSQRANEKIVLINDAINEHVKRERSHFLFNSYDDLNKKITSSIEELENVESLTSKWHEVKERLGKADYSTFDTIVFCFGVLPALTEMVERSLGKDDRFTLIFQRLGNAIRAYGGPCPAKGTHDRELGKNLFSLPERIDNFCQLLRHYCQAINESKDIEINPVFVAIDGFKNIFEALYFKQRYASFFLVAVSGDKDSGKKRKSLRLSGFNEPNAVDLGESVSSMKKIYAKFYEEAIEEDTEGKPHLKDNGPSFQEMGLSEEQYSFCKEVAEHDELRSECYRKKLAPFILQDVMTCIESADVFITRDIGEEDVACDRILVRSLARFVALIMHPAIIKPTKIEKCMQIAMSAKLNSGCLSRQVGAVVTDSNYNILSLGWNDAPCAVESCARRNLFDIARKYDPDAYSDFELTNPDFRKYIDRIHQELRRRNTMTVLGGLPASYCFKDIYQDMIKERDQIHTRALHAEERALAACGNDRARGGFLFTTSSPCELCAKKVKEAGIEKIYYIEQYPGISHDHIIDDGPYDARAEYEFFVGSVGFAYTKLYTPSIPYKDELEALGISPKQLHESAIKELLENN